MSLTGTAFFCLVVVLSVVAFAGAVVLQPRLAARGPRAVTARVTSMLLVNLLVVFAVLVGANDRFSFFADWQDVRGALFGGGQATDAYTAGGPVVPPSTTGRPTTTNKATQDVRFFNVTGSGLTGKVMVTLPPGYDSAANSDRYYPVLETFHGYPGTPEQWNRSMAIRSALDKAAAHHQIGDVITLSPTWEFPAGVDTECVNGGTKGPPVETWLTRDVPAWARHAFRIQQGRGSWAAIGISAGAWCAAMTAMLHPMQYAAGIVLGGYFAPEFERYRPFTATSERGSHYDLVALAKRNPPPVALWVQTSKADPISYPSTVRMLAATRAPMTLRAVVLQHAGHRLGIWAGLLPTALAWLGHLPGFAPA